MKLFSLLPKRLIHLACNSPKRKFRRPLMHGLEPDGFRD
jgi:hypothetical protein